MGKDHKKIPSSRDLIVMYQQVQLKWSSYILE